MDNTYLADAIKASFTHKKVGEYLRRDIIKPGISLKDIATITENKIKEYINFDPENQLLRGIAFPVGLSINDCAAHYTPNIDDPDIILQKNDILKVDYGVHFNGTIIDSAFTMHFDEKYDEFIKISKDVTNFAVKQCGPDAILGEIGKEIEEYVYSCQLEIDNKIIPLKTMRDLCGHLISPYTIHAGKAVPNTAIYYPFRMKENEFYAVEPFITTGNGISISKDNNSHYMLKNDESVKSVKSNLLYDIIQKNFYTLPFCKKWLYELYLVDNNDTKFNESLNKLVKENIVQEYPPLHDIPGSLISQFEHTIFIRDKGIINLTKNNFY
jgi:methionyl aminopeptidase